MLQLLSFHDIRYRRHIDEKVADFVVAIQSLSKEIQSLETKFHQHVIRGLEFSIDSARYVVSFQHIMHVSSASDAFSIPLSEFDYLSYEGKIIPVRRYGESTPEYIIILENNGMFMGIYCNFIRDIDSFVHWNEEFKSWTQQKPQRLHFLFG